MAGSLGKPSKPGDRLNKQRTFYLLLKPDSTNLRTVLPISASGRLHYISPPLLEPAHPVAPLAEFTQYWTASGKPSITVTATFDDCKNSSLDMMNDTTSQAFLKAFRKFTEKLSKEHLEEFLNLGSMKDVYMCIQQLEDKLKQNKTQRYLARLNPYLEGLQQYAKVIDVIVQIRPEIMAIVWGCTRFILQAAGTHLAFFDSLLDALERIGENLPRQQQLENVFHNNPRVQRISILMYEDILTFHWETLNFLRKKVFKQVIHILLQPFEQTFGTIVGRLERHRMLLDYEAIAAHIEAANEDRQLEEKQKREQENYRKQEQLKAWLKPMDNGLKMAFMHKELDKLTSTSEGREAMQHIWLMELDALKSWIGLDNDGKPIIWLTGMPGAGKSFLAYRLFLELKRKTSKVTADCVCYAFLSSEQPGPITYDGVLKTFIFQLLQNSPCLISYLFQEYTSRDFQGFCAPMNRNDLSQILKACLDYIPGSIYMILDGLDEVEEDDRKAVLQTILILHDPSKKLRIFISSRPETDIEDELLSLEGQFEHIAIGTQNANDITAYVEACGRDLRKAFSYDEMSRDVVASILMKISSKACGMFLWARLVLHDLARCTNLEGLQEAVSNLPKGLEEAYQRILDRIENNRDSALGRDAIRILQMIICSKRPLRKQEVQHLLAIQTGDICIEQRRLLRRRLEELCGPILTVEDGTNFRSTEHEPQIRSSGLVSEEEDLPWLQTMWPHLYHWLREINSYTSGMDWQAHVHSKHPLSVQGNLERIRERFRAAVAASNPTDLSRMQSLYGPNLFQCTRSLCPYYWDGFPTEDELNIHLQSHMRPFQCKDQNCYWSTAGFSTITELSQHNNKFHAAVEGSSRTLKGNPIFKNVRMPAQHKVLIDAIFQGSVELVREVLSQNTSILILNKVVAGKRAVEYAVEQKDLEITLMLFEAGARPRDMQKFLVDAIAQGNVELVKKLVSWVNFRLNLNEVVAGKTALEYAVEQKNVEMMLMLVEQGAKGVRGNGEQKAKPFCDAFWLQQQYYRSVGQVLAECGDGNVRRQYLEAMFQAGKSNVRDSSLWILALSIIDSENELQHLLSNDDFTKTLNLISNPGSLSHYTTLQLTYTPLAYAIARGPRHCGILKLLVQAGAKPWTEPLRNGGWEALPGLRLIHRLLSERSTGLQLRMLMLATNPLHGQRSFQTLYFSHYQDSSLINEYIANDFQWSEVADYMAMQGRSLLQLGIDYLAEERVNMDLREKHQWDASIESDPSISILFASSLIQLARTIPKSLKGIIRPPSWTRYNEVVHSEINDIVRKCGGNEDPKGYSRADCKAVQLRLSQLSLIRWPSLICRILDEAEFWTVQSFTWTYQSPVANLSSHEKRNTTRIYTMGGHPRHIRFDIAVLRGSFCTRVNLLPTGEEKGNELQCLSHRLTALPKSRN
ncbi:hypothetical protein BDZ91DRAFT_794710 [Kalaharituber pfeilii]|nr:hypothetical protein BDZ91DRAFT_794710 [Kalaharituber pfeilii]